VFFCCAFLSDFIGVYDLERLDFCQTRAMVDVGIEKSEDHEVGRQTSITNKSQFQVPEKKQYRVGRHQHLGIRAVVSCRRAYDTAKSRPLESTLSRLA
jgi:hypothetical protein